MSEDKNNELLTVKDYLIEREVDGHGRKAYSAVLWNTTLEVLKEAHAGQPVLIWRAGGGKKWGAPRWALERAWKWLSIRMAEKASQSLPPTQDTL